MWVLRVFEFVCEYIYICNIYIYYRGKVSTRSRLFFFSSPLDYPSLWSFVLFFFAVRVVATCSFLFVEIEISLLVFFNDRPPAPSLLLLPLLPVFRLRVGKQSREKKKKKEKAHTETRRTHRTYLAREKSALKNHRPAARTTRAWECKLYL